MRAAGGSLKPDTNGSAEPVAASYVLALDLAYDPFELGAEHDFFYTGALRAEALDRLVHRCRFSDQLQLLCAARGSGKSQLVDHAISLLQTVMDCCRIDALHNPDSLALRARMIEQFVLPVGAREPIEVLAQALREQAQVDGMVEPVLVVVEHAQLLESDAIAMLLRLQLELAGVMHLLLVGDERLLDGVRAELSAGLALEYSLTRLEPLSEAETAEYILGSLRAAGYAGELPLDRDQLSVLHERARGNIGDIQQLLPLLLGEQGASAVRRQRWRLPARHLLAVAVLALSVLILFVVGGRDVARHSESRPAADVTSQPLALKLLSEDGATTNGVLEAAAQEPALLPAGREQQIDSDPISAAAAEPTVSAALEQQSGESAADETQTDAAERQRRSSQQQRTVPTTAEVALPVQAVGNGELPLESVAPQSAGGDAAQRVFARDEQRLQAMSADSYVLQLFGSYQASSAQEFIDRYDGLPLHGYETVHQGRPWFVVVAAPYASRALAKEAATELPAALQKQQPWLRSMSAIQKALVRQ